MSGVLGKFEKQPADVLDYDFDYSDWLDDRADSIATATVVADRAGISVTNVAHAFGVVKAYVAGGTNGQSYKLTCTVITAGGRTKQAEMTIKIKEI